MPAYIICPLILAAMIGLVALRIFKCSRPQPPRDDSYGFGLTADDLKRVFRATENGL